MQTYTWPDATLRELYLLVKEVHPQARRPTARLDFAFVYPDRKGRNVMRQVCCLATAGLAGSCSTGNSAELLCAGGPGAGRAHRS